MLYLKKVDRRANIDFGVYQLEMKGFRKKMEHQRKKYKNFPGDYFYGLSRNLSLNRYFYYDRVFRLCPDIKKGYKKNTVIIDNKQTTLKNPLETGIWVGTLPEKVAFYVMLLGSGSFL
ncbi:MAG: hypothetical protein CM1200mP30_04510 [Pseudomonadota bacterium]|nr:MAG: hypothetical protein CM1200mP30_04510 [Pseudomonadota bacterium]